MDEQVVANVMNEGIDAIQVVLVPLAAAGLCAWINAVTKDSTGGKAVRGVKRAISLIGGAVKHGANDPAKN